MASTPNPMADDMPPPPVVSKQTIQMTGLLVDVYGLEEVSPAATHVCCLWLHHPRKGDKSRMADIAARCIAAWNASPRAAASSKALIALAYDQRNHGSRLVDELAIGAWREGNATHAQDMFGVIAGMVSDQALLLDSVGSYLFVGSGKVLDQHLALGVSLGGHSVWQLLFADDRVSAGVCVIGCPDYMYLMSDRAKLSKLSTFAADNGASFLGSKDFPEALVSACKRTDPKAMLFGTDAVSETAGPLNEKRKAKLKERVGGKKFLICSGGEDKLVAYKCSEPFLTWFKKVAGETGVYVEDNVYPGIGHSFSAGMINDAVRFVVDAVSVSDPGESRQGVSKI